MITKHHDAEQQKLERRMLASTADLSQVAAGKFKGVLLPGHPPSSGRLHPDCNFAAPYACDTGPAPQPIHT